MTSYTLLDDLPTPERYDAGDRVAREQADRMEALGFGDNWMYEDELPEDITDDEYDRWYAQSWVDFVRLGSRLQNWGGGKCPCHDRYLQVCAGHWYCPDSDTFFGRVE